MGSDSLFVKCNTCGKDIAKSARVCPSCGANNKKLKPLHWVGIGLLGLMIIGAINSPNKNTSNSSEEKNTVVKSEIPTEESNFVGVITGYTNKFSDAKNELQQSTLRDSRKIQIANSLQSRSVSGWIGKINHIETNSEGKGVLSVSLSPDVVIKTWNNALSDITTNTLIEKGSPVYSELINLSPGQKIEFSGRFYESDTDYITETSVTINGSMRSPEFLFKFTSIKPIN